MSKASMSMISSLSTDSGSFISNSVVAQDGSTRCVLCLKKNAVTSCKQCVRCNQMLCKTCFKVDTSKASSAQKQLFSSSQIGKCCFSDLIFQHNLLSDVTVQWGKDSLLSTKWTSLSQPDDYCFFNETASSGDDTFEKSVQLSNTKYKDHAEMKLIEKEVFEEDIYARKNLSRSFAEFLTTIAADISTDKIKEDLVILLKAFTSFFLQLRETPEDRLYHRGHGMLAIFLLCFCSMKRAFQAMKDIFTVYYLDILHPDYIKKDENFQSVVKHIVFIYLENFAKKKEPTPSFIEKLVGFARRSLLQQYNSFFLNQLNFSSAFVIIEQLFEQQSYAVITKAIAAVIQINLKSIVEAENDKVNLREIIYNKVQPDLMSQYMHSQWAILSNDAKEKILDAHYIQCENENRKKYDIGADELHRRVKDCLKKQKNHFKIMEDHYLKENMDVKRALALAIRELEFKSHKLQKMEVEKNNQAVKYNALLRKYEINEIEFEDIQNKLQFLNERAGKRQMHYNKEYEEQVANLQHQVKNQKLDFKELETLQKGIQNDMKVQLEEKDLTIKRLKEVIQFMHRIGQGSNTQEVQEQLSSVLKEQEEYGGIKQSNYEDQEEIDKRQFRSYAQASQTSSIIKRQIITTPSRVPSNNNQDNKSQLKDSINQQNQLESPSKNQNKQTLNIKGSNNNNNDVQQDTEESEIDMKMFNANVPLDYHEDQFNSTGTMVIKSSNQEQRDRQNSQDISQSLFEMYKSISSNSNNNDLNIYLKRQQNSLDSISVDNITPSPSKEIPASLIAPSAHSFSENQNKVNRDYENTVKTLSQQSENIHSENALSKIGSATKQQGKNHRAATTVVNQNNNTIITSIRKYSQQIDVQPPDDEQVTAMTNSDQTLHSQKKE